MFIFTVKLWLESFIPSKPEASISSWTDVTIVLELSSVRNMPLQLVKGCWAASSVMYFSWVIGGFGSFNIICPSPAQSTLGMITSRFATPNIMLTAKFAFIKICKQRSRFQYTWLAIAVANQFGEKLFQTSLHGVDTFFGRAWNLIKWKSPNQTSCHLQQTGN